MIQIMQLSRLDDGIRAFWRVRLEQGRRAAGVGAYRQVKYGRPSDRLLIQVIIDVAVAVGV
jgi:hypothetical protein